MPQFADWVQLLKDVGVFEFYLPFVILFSLLYGLLTKSAIFGEVGPSDKTGGKVNKGVRNINLILSLASAFYVMAYTDGGIILTQFFARFFAQTTVALVTLLASGMIITLLLGVARGGGVKDETITDTLKKLIEPAIWVALLLGLGLFLSSGGAGIFPGINISLAGIDPQTLTLIILVLITIGIIMWLTGKET